MILKKCSFLVSRSATCNKAVFGGSISRFNSNASSANVSNNSDNSSNNNESSDKKPGSHHKKYANRPIIQEQRSRNQALEEKAKQLGLEWRVVSASILQRYPKLASEPEVWEQNMTAVQEELDTMYQSAFIEATEGTKAGILAGLDANTTLDKLPLQAASRITEADKANDLKSLNRKLGDSLFLIVQRNRKDCPWQFPQGKLQDDEETLRQGSERVLSRAVGKIGRWFISNAPLAYYCYEYPPEMQKARNQFGAKVFFYRAELTAGNIKLETRLYKDYAWVTRAEAAEYFPKEMKSFVHSILPF